MGEKIDLVIHSGHKERTHYITLSRVNSLPLRGNTAKALSEASTSGEGALPPQDLTLSSCYYQ